MNPIVRRVAGTPLRKDAEYALPERIHHAGGILVASQLTLGIEPRLQFSWSVAPHHWADGFTLLIFHSRAGFSAEKHPVDLNAHGQLIIETVRDDAHSTYPEEGPQYYTFVLHKKVWLGLREKLSVVRFSENVPSAKVAIGRIKDQLELEDMRRRHEVGDIEHEARVNEARMRQLRSRRDLAQAESLRDKNPAPRDGVIEQELADVDAMIDALFALRRKKAELRKDPRFRKLSREEREKVLNRIDERLDAGEISARRDMPE